MAFDRIDWTTSKMEQVGLMADHPVLLGRAVGRCGNHSFVPSRRVNSLHSIVHLGSVRVVDDLILDAVRVEKIETAAWFIVGMAEGLETSGDHTCLGGVKIVDFDANMVQRSALENTSATLAVSPPA
jgi:hypothetical protein